MANNVRNAKKPVAKAKALRGGWQEQWRYAWTNTLADMLRQ
ncbi:cell division protein FtsX, partial [Dickeya dadantii]|nr:cell division protein FtsX [Dickeya dadantii]